MSTTSTSLPDLVPYDFYLIRNLKKILGGRGFSPEKLRGAFDGYLRNGIKTLGWDFKKYDFFK
jgi:hypothetical protein